MRGGLAAAIVGVLLATSAARAAEDAHPGVAVYTTYCAGCHDNPGTTKAAPLSALRQMNTETLRHALTEGLMREQAAAIPRRELRALIDYLAVKAYDSDDWLTSWQCKDGGAVDVKAPVVLAMPGVDLANSRHMTAAQAGLSGADIGQLELAWAIGFPETNALRASPVIVGRTMFYSPSPTGRVLAFDIDAPCLRWTYAAGTALRSSLTFGRLADDGPMALVFADQGGQVHAVEAATGKRIFKVEGRHTRNGTITGAPVIHGNRIIVPVSASGVGRAVNPKYECCDEHGAVVALDARTGEQVWTWHTMADATYTGATSRDGVRLRGPSGAPIWSTPTIDIKRNLIYVTTGQNTSLPATTTSDAVIALDLETGKQKWGFQALARDVWNMSCRLPVSRSGPNCPPPADSALKDFDFGGAAILLSRPDGRDLVLAGQKSGDVWALDADTGKVVWNRRFGQGSPLGGIHWGIASDGARVYAPISDPIPARAGFRPEPGMNAVDVASGEVVWRTPVTASCDGVRKPRFDACGYRFGLSATPLVVDAAVIAGALDGRLYAFAATTGAVIFEYDTLRDFTTVNGVAAKGGSIDSHSVFAGGGMLFVGSGYGNFGQAPGNVLLAFRPAAGAGTAAAP